MSPRSVPRSGVGGEEITEGGAYEWGARALFAAPSLAALTPAQEEELRALISELEQVERERDVERGRERGREREREREVQGPHTAAAPPPRLPAAPVALSISRPLSAEGGTGQKKSRQS